MVKQSRMQKFFPETPEKKVGSCYRVYDVGLNVNSKLLSKTFVIPIRIFRFPTKV